MWDVDGCGYSVTTRPGEADCREKCWFAISSIGMWHHMERGGWLCRTGHQNQLRWCNSSTWEECKIYIYIWLHLIIHVYIYPIIYRYIWYDITYILMIHWFLQHIFTPCCEVTVGNSHWRWGNSPDPMVDGHGKNHHQIKWFATHRTQKGGVYVYIDAVWKKTSLEFFMNVCKYKKHDTLCQCAFYQFFSPNAIIYIYILYIYILVFPQWARRNTPWSWSQLSLPALMVCLGTGSSAVQKPVAGNGFSWFSCMKMTDNMYIYTVWFYSRY